MAAKQLADKGLRNGLVQRKNGIYAPCRSQTRVEINRAKIGESEAYDDIAAIDLGAGEWGAKFTSETRALGVGGYLSGRFMLHTATWLNSFARMRRTIRPFTRISHASHSPTAVFWPETYRNSPFRPRKDCFQGRRTRANCDLPVSFSYCTYTMCAAFCEPVMLYRTSMSRPGERFAGRLGGVVLSALGRVLVLAVGVASEVTDDREQAAKAIAGIRSITISAD